MSKAKIGLIVVASPIESGGERAEVLVQSAVSMLSAQAEVVVGCKEVWSHADAAVVVSQMKKECLDCCVVITASWVMDSLDYIIANELKMPVVYWAVPYKETFSLACVQHFSSILKREGIPFDFVYGLADAEGLKETILDNAKAGQIVKKIKNSRIGLLGKRQTWRIAGAQDMASEEWEFSKKFGTTIIHIDMDEMEEIRKDITADEIAEARKSHDNYDVEVEIEEPVMDLLTANYVAVKKLMEAYELDMVAAECYPDFGGSMNLASSWLAQEGVVLDTEGDVSHSVMEFILNMIGDKTPCALFELGEMHEADNYLIGAHEGSSAVGLAEDSKLVKVVQGSDTGAAIGFPMKEMKCATVVNLTGAAGAYSLFVKTVEVVKTTEEDWIDSGYKLLTTLKIEEKPSEYMAYCVANGIDHHLVLKEGNYIKVLEKVAYYLDIKSI